MCVQTGTRALNGKEKQELVTEENNFSEQLLTKQKSLECLHTHSTLLPTTVRNGRKKPKVAFSNDFSATSRKDDHTDDFKVVWMLRTQRTNIFTQKPSIQL